MYPNTWETEAGFGVSVGIAEGGGGTSTSTIGGHVDTEIDIGAAFSKHGERWKGIGPVFSRGWETSWSTGHEAMTTTFASGSFDSFTPMEAQGSGVAPDFDQLGVIETHDWCYVYYEPSLGNIDVCLPFPSGDMSFVPYNLEVWWTELAEEYPDTWVPVGRNLAKGLTGAVSQSSTFSSLSTADKAVDGNRNGDYNAESVASHEQVRRGVLLLAVGPGQRDHGPSGCALHPRQAVDQRHPPLEPHRLLQRPAQGRVCVRLRRAVSVHRPEYVEDRARTSGGTSSRQPTHPSSARSCL